MSDASSPIPLVVLLVEDSPPLAKAQIRLLERAGYAVTWADNGADGLRLAKEMSPAGIVLDGCLPVLDGFEVCRRLKIDPDLQRIPVLFCSGQPDAGERARSVGANDFLAKPEEVTLLAERLARLTGV